jgi:hypothetical protein
MESSPLTEATDIGQSISVASQLPRRPVTQSLKAAVQSSPKRNLVSVSAKESRHGKHKKKEKTIDEKIEEDRQREQLLGAFQELKRGGWEFRLPTNTWSVEKLRAFYEELNQKIARNALPRAAAPPPAPAATQASGSSSPVQPQVPGAAPGTAPPSGNSTLGGIYYGIMWGLSQMKNFEMLEDTVTANAPIMDPLLAKLAAELNIPNDIFGSSVPAIVPVLAITTATLLGSYTASKTREIMADPVQFDPRKAKFLAMGSMTARLIGGPLKLKLPEMPEFLGRQKIGVEVPDEFRDLQ